MDLLFEIKENLEELYLAENQISDYDLNYVVDPLCQMPKLKVFAIPRNAITNVGIVNLITKIVEQNTS